MTWRTVGEYLHTVETKGVSVNFATFVSAATLRMNVIGMDDVDPTPEQLEIMKSQVAQAMEDGAHLREYFCPLRLKSVPKCVSR
jgi:N-acyl-D-amino-acid deacylase